MVIEADLVISILLLVISIPMTVITTCNTLINIILVTPLYGIVVIATTRRVELLYRLAIPLSCILSLIPQLPDLPVIHLHIVPEPII